MKSRNPYWVMVVMDQFSRKIIGFSSNKGYISGADLCCMFNKIISKKDLPKYLSSDNDPLFGYHQWQANLRILEIEEIKSVPYTPISHPFIERLIGTVRRELLDQTLFWNHQDLEKKLELFRQYYNNERGHCGIGKIPPANKAGEDNPNLVSLDDYRWKKHCHGLFQLPIAA